MRGVSASPGLGRSLAGRRVFVTGGAGFVGRRLVVRLAASGARVISLDRRAASASGGVRVLRGDCRRPEDWESGLRGVEVVMHLAAAQGHRASMEHPLRDYEDGVAALLGVLEASARSAPRARIVLASTRQIHGAPTRLPVAEDHPIHPPDAHSAHKEAAEHLVRHHAARHRTGHAILRFPNLYGPGMDLAPERAGFAGSFLRAALAGEPVTILGRSTLLRDPTHVDDAVRALLLAAPPGAPSGTWNLGGAPVTLRDFATAVFGALATRPRIREEPLPPALAAIAVGDMICDSRKIARDLGWAPEVPLDSGLAETVGSLRSGGCSP